MEQQASSLPTALMRRLPPAANDGNYYLDVRVGSAWDGIIVVNEFGRYLGVYVRRHIEFLPLPFELSAVEEIRGASMPNRILAALPFDIWTGSVLAIVLVSPVFLGLAAWISPLIAVMSIVTCAAAIYTMYQAPGFLFIRFPVAMLGVAQTVAGAIGVARYLFD